MRPSLRRSLGVACVGLTTLLLATALAGPSASATASAPTPALTGDCGGTTIAKSTGGAWACTFDDEFDGTALNTANWWPLSTATTGFHALAECLTPNNVSVGDGNLILTATKSATSTKCSTNFSTQYRSGMVLSSGLFAQAYGRFEMRARFPSGSGFQPAFWMLPQNPYGNTGSYEYGEIDAAEAYTAYPGLVSPHLHYVTTPGTSGGGVNCVVPTSSSDYNTYTVEWTPTRMTFLYDGTTCWSTTWVPQWPYAPFLSSAPIPFDQPFYLLVTLAVGNSQTPYNVPNAQTPFPAQMSVDYIRAWS